MGNITTLEEITRVYQVVPARPSKEKVEEAKTLINDVDNEEASKLEAIDTEIKGNKVLEELLSGYKEVKKALLRYENKERKSEAVRILDLENTHQVFADLVKEVFRSAWKDKPMAPASLLDVKGGKMSMESLIDKAAEEGTKELSLSNSQMITLDLSMNHIIKWLPDSIGELTSLITLDLSKTCIARLRDSIGELTSLITLDLSMNHIEWLPDSIGELTSLITLDLSKNYIRRLPDSIGKLTSLITLDLSENYIRRLPDSIGELMSLITLDLSKNHILTLPETIGGLSSLTTLDLSSNTLEQLPDSIGDLQNLLSLLLNRNSLYNLPPSIGKLTRLEELNLDSNELTSLPDTIASLVSLRKLITARNNLTELPYGIYYCTSLEELSVAHNRLKEFPQSPRKTAEKDAVRFMAVAKKGWKKFFSFCKNGSGGGAGRSSI